MELEINKLLEITISINDGYDNLTYLSCLNSENSSYYQEVLDKLDNYLLDEMNYYNNLDIEQVEVLLNIFNKEDSNVIIKRCLVKLNERYIKLLKDDNLDVATLLLLTPPKEAIDLIDYLDERQINNYDNIMAFVYLNAIKNMYDKVNKMECYDKKEEKFLMKLKKSLNIYKYEFYIMSSLLERLGLLYKYDIRNVKKVKYDKKNIEIYYDECFRVLDTLKYIDYNNMDCENILELLFFTSVFEELISILDKDRLVIISNYINKFLDIDFSNNICNNMIKIRRNEL